MLGTPPAFILSQDQTLVKSVCSVQESLLAILSLYCVWFVWTVLRNFLFKEIFKGCCLLFSYQGSCRSLSSDSFNILSNPFRFVKNFFYFPVSLFHFPFGPLQATPCIIYHISKALSTVFSSAFSALPAPFPPLSHPRLFRLRVSGWHDFLRLFKAPSSATDAILSPQEVIVNVFSLFYLFQTIHTILT